MDFGFGVKLLPLEPKHSESTFLWRNNVSIYKWCRQREPLKMKDHLKYIESLPEREDVKMFVIEKEEKVVGVCGLTDIDLINGRAEFSLYIAPYCHGQGLGKSALRSIIAYGFKKLRLNRIWGETYEGNPALKMFKSIGMILEGTRKEFYFRDGKFIDCHLVSINQSEFEKALKELKDDTYC